MQLEVTCGNACLQQLGIPARVYFTVIEIVVEC
jgi:hypothetical protein